MSDTERPEGMHSLPSILDLADVSREIWAMVNAEADAEDRALWLAAWVDAWAWIGWLASTDLTQTMLMRMCTELVGSVRMAFRSHQTQLDNLRVDVEKLRRKVKG